MTNSTSPQLNPLPVSIETLFDLSSLPELKQNESRLLIQASIAARRQQQPLSLKRAWQNLKQPVSVELFLKQLRNVIQDPTLDIPSQRTAALARAIELMNVRFEALVEKGAFDEVLPRLTALPMLYSPRAGKGASKWLRANAIFETKKVASEALLMYRGRDSSAVRNISWADLAEISVRVAYTTSIELECITIPLRKKALAYWRYSKKRKTAIKASQGVVYHLGGIDTLLWPDWADHCLSLPSRVAIDPTRYTIAAKHILNDFFADPSNASEATAILKSQMSSKTYPEAVNEAVQNITRCIEKL